MISKGSCSANTCWEFEKMWEISKMKTLGGYIFGPIFRWPVERQIPWHSLHGNDNPGFGQFPRRYISRYHFLTAWKWYHLQHLGCISYWEFTMETVLRRKNFDTHIMDSSCWVATTCHILSFIDFTSCVCVCGFWVIVPRQSPRHSYGKSVLPFAKRTWQFHFHLQIVMFMNHIWII